MAIQCMITKLHNKGMKFYNNLEKSALLMTYISKLGAKFSQYGKSKEETSSEDE